ncbi:hypothetical protein NE237_031848 [Protea cynaroides]|uniref:Amidase domain-containing protein n=1 Tax=Protea cynaroides TaxID=273540 RepID=A0A9Q0L2E0_9MAGN|nr:hypothetical protein NE237_031848 [Protea cynaroides]
MLGSLNNGCHCKYSSVRVLDSVSADDLKAKAVHKCLKDHLKRGTCPNFSSVPKPISSLSPPPITTLTSPSSCHHLQPHYPHHPNHQNRRASSAAASGGVGSGGGVTYSYQVPPLAMVDDVVDVVDAEEAQESLSLLTQKRSSLKPRSSSVPRRRMQAPEMIPQWGQDVFLQSENTTRTGSPAYQATLANMQSLIENGVVKLMTQNNLDALITLDATITSVLAIGGFPGISVPAGYGPDGTPFAGICFSGLRGYEPRLIEIAYGFEKATKIRKPPTFLVYDPQ